jgi:hypothetical protein
MLVGEYNTSGTMLRRYVPGQGVGRIGVRVDFLPVSTDVLSVIPLGFS